MKAGGGGSSGKGGAAGRKGGRQPQPKQRQPQRQQSKKRRRGNPGKGILETGSRFMRSVSSATMAEERDKAPEGSEERAVWDGCILRRADIKCRDIAKKVGMPYSTMRNRLIRMHENKKMKMTYDDARYIDRGRYYILDVTEETMFRGIDEMNKGKRGRPFVYCRDAFWLAYVFKELTGIPYRSLAGAARNKAAGRFRTPSYSTYRERIASLKIEEDDTDGRVWFTSRGERYEVGMVLMDGSSLKGTSRSEYRQITYGNGSNACHKIAVAVDSNAKKVLFVVVTDQSVGESPATLDCLLDGAVRNVSANPGMTLAQGAVAAYDGAVDAAESYEIADKVGVGLVVPVRINSSANPVPDEEVVGEGEPRSGAAEPRAAESEPRAAESEPRAAESEPRAAESEPRAAESEPRAAESEPRAAESEPRAAESEPRAAESEPRAAESEPRAAESEPRAAESEPRAAESEPRAAEPDEPNSTASPPGQPQDHRKGAAMRKMAVYKQLGGMDEITPETEKALRNMSVQEKRANRRLWRTTSGYNMRVGVEGYFSAFKRIFGDKVMSRKRDTAEQEIRMKVAIYNDMIGMAVANGHTAKKVWVRSSKDAGGTSCRGRTSGGRRVDSKRSNRQAAPGHAGGGDAGRLAGASEGGGDAGRLAGASEGGGDAGRLAGASEGGGDAGRLAGASEGGGDAGRLAGAKTEYG